MVYQADPARYGSMPYRRCGRSGLKLPAISLGLWQNFGSLAPFENTRAMILRAFDLGITHFDLANNYGPLPGSAEENFGRVMRDDLRPYRDELIISTKAGYTMWEGPYGDFGSRKYLLASLDQSLRRMGLDYVDIFYSHRPDPQTPIEETMGALAQAVRQGKALYAGISNYNARQTADAVRAAREFGLTLTIHQPSYSMYNRWVEEDGLLNVLDENGMGSVAFSPLQQGLLTSRYLLGVPSDSRAAAPTGTIDTNDITKGLIEKSRRLDQIARERGQTLAQMALAWVLRGGRVTSAIIGASRVSQIEENAGAVKVLSFSDDEIARIEAILTL